MFVSLYRGFLNGLNSLLFGTIIGISASDAALAAGIATGLILVLLLIARPLLFANLDPTSPPLRITSPPGPGPP